MLHRPSMIVAASLGMVALATVVLIAIVVRGQGRSTAEVAELLDRATMAVLYCQTERADGLLRTAGREELTPAQSIRLSRLYGLRAECAPAPEPAPRSILRRVGLNPLAPAAPPPPTPDPPLEVEGSHDSDLPLLQERDDATDTDRPNDTDRLHDTAAATVLSEAPGSVDPLPTVAAATSTPPARPDPGAPPTPIAPPALPTEVVVTSIREVEAVMLEVVARAEDEGVPADYATAVSAGFVRHLVSLVPGPDAYRLTPRDMAARIVDGHREGRSRARVAAAMRQLGRHR